MMPPWDWFLGRKKWRGESAQNGEMRKAICLFLCHFCTQQTYKYHCPVEVADIVLHMSELMNWLPPDHRMFTLDILVPSCWKKKKNTKQTWRNILVFKEKFKKVHCWNSTLTSVSNNILMQLLTQVIFLVVSRAHAKSHPLFYRRGFASLQLCAWTV